MSQPIQFTKVKVSPFRPAHHPESVIDIALPPVIGIAGNAGAGKDTLTNALGPWLAARDQHAAGALRRMSDPIKRMVATLYTGARESTGEEPKALNFNDPAFKAEVLIPGLPVTVRQALQHFGTEGGRALHPDFWVALMEAHLKAHFEHAVEMFGAPGFAIIPDIRFDNEVEMVRRLGGVVVYVSRPENPTPRMEHSSEGQPLEVDFTITNIGAEPKVAGEAMAAEVLWFFEHLLDDTAKPWKGRHLVEVEPKADCVINQMAAKAEETKA